MSKKVAVGLCTIVSMAMIAASVFAAIQTQNFIREASIGDGVVAGLPFGGSHPEIELTTRSGHKVQILPGGMIWGYKMSDRVRILYRGTDVPCVISPF